MPRYYSPPSGSMGVAALMLKRWRLAFNPDTEYFQFRHLWVLLPGLPLHLWNEDSLRAIGNAIGQFISLDTQSLKSPSRIMGRILVAIDITTGLPDKLDIVWRGRTHQQALDYLGLPFRCNLCRETGHLRDSCPGKFSSQCSEEDELRLNPPEYTEADPSLAYLDVNPAHCPPSPEQTINLFQSSDFYVRPSSIHLLPQKKKTLILSVGSPTPLEQ
jgi:hypothetical protein